MQNIAQNVANMAKTRRGEHVLFRSFGLNVIDDANGLTRGEISRQLKEFYPQINRFSVVLSKNFTGFAQYAINLEGNRIAVI